MTRFDFAISFAGPERKLAKNLADELVAAGFRVFFDEYFEHEMLGGDGVDYLNNVFLEDSRYCIALVSESYERRSWTQLERRAAQAREHRYGPGGLLPVVVDSTRPPWLLPTRVYFDLSVRTLPTLVDVLRRKHTAEDATTFRESVRLALAPLKRPLSIAAGWAADDFMVWSARADEGDCQVVRVFPDASFSVWSRVVLPLTRSVRWLLCTASGSLVGIPDNDPPGIQILRQHDSEPTVLVPPRPYKWTSATDAKEHDGAVVIGYCGGDVWELDPQSGKLKELRPGSDDVQYTYVDFWKDSVVVALEERHSLEVRRRSDGRLLHELQSPIAAEGLCCFPEADVIAVAGIDAVATMRYSNGEVIATEEIVGQGPYRSERIVDAALLGLISGLPLPGNVLEVFDARGGRRLLRRRAVGPAGWSSVALSRSGRFVAATLDTEALIHERTPIGTRAPAV